MGEGVRLLNFYFFQKPPHIGNHRHVTAFTNLTPFQPGFRRTAHGNFSAFKIAVGPGDVLGFAKASPKVILP